jgi:DNA invertase Pin-like site-specific DNA recombinase
VVCFGDGAWAKSIARVTIIPGRVLTAFADFLGAPDSITVRDAEVRRLRFEEGMGVTEIGRRLGISKPTVYKALQSLSQEG